MTRACILLILCFSSFIVAMEFERLQLVRQGAIEDLAYHYQLKVDDRVIFSDSGNKGSTGNVVFDGKNISGNSIIAAACYMEEKYSTFDECAIKYFESIRHIAKSRTNRVMARNLKRVALKVAKSPVFEWAKHCASKVGYSRFYDRAASTQFVKDLEEMSSAGQYVKTIGLFIPNTEALKCDGSFQRRTTAGLTLKTTCREGLNTTTDVVSPDIAKCYAKDAFVNSYSESEFDSFVKPTSSASGNFYTTSFLLLVSSIVLLMIQ